MPKKRMGKKLIGTSKKKTQKKHRSSEDSAQRKKYERGGRIEAYTMGEASGSKDWP